MRQVPISTSEKNFVKQTISHNQRLDGRRNDEFRPLTINLGSEWGSAHVALGETKVLAQVTCELGQPKSTRPNEGTMFINVELGPMAGMNFEAGRNSSLAITLNRTLERTLKDSHCVDLESLCVTAEDRAWILRLDVNILSHDGNLIDCSSIAALCALAHFRRPDISIDGHLVKIHTEAEKEFIPIVIHHHPVCVSFGIFNDGYVSVADPTLIEESIAESSIVFGLNSYRELCCLNLAGTTLTSVHFLLQCSQKAAIRSKIIVDQIKATIEKDLENRATGKKVGFTECLHLNSITSLSEERLAIRLRDFKFSELGENTNAKMEVDKSDNEEENNVILLGKNTAVINSSQKNIKWISGSEESDGDCDHNIDDSKNLSKSDISSCIPSSIKKTNSPDSDSEEETRIYL